MSCTSCSHPSPPGWIYLTLRASASICTYLPAVPSWFHTHSQGSWQLAIGQCRHGAGGAGCPPMLSLDEGSPAESPGQGHVGAPHLQLAPSHPDSLWSAGGLLTAVSHAGNQCLTSVFGIICIIYSWFCLPTCIHTDPEQASTRYYILALCHGKCTLCEYLFLVLDHGCVLPSLSLLLKTKCRDTDLLSWQKMQKYVVLESCVTLWLAGEA